MANQQKKTDVKTPQAESVESSIVRRRRLLKKAAILGVPAMLTLPGRAFAQSTGSGDMSGNMTA